MSDESASGVIAAALVAALRTVEGLSGASDGPPLRSGDGHAIVEIGPETDWGHKSGAGAEVRVAVTIEAGGEDPARTRRLLARAQAAIAAMTPDHDGWRLVTMVPVRARVLREAGPKWRAVADYRARMMRE